MPSLILFSFWSFSVGIKIHHPNSVQDLRNSKRGAEYCKSRPPLASKGRHQHAARLCLIMAGSQSWISGNVSYLVQHQKLSSSRKKKAGSKSMWELLPKMRPALLQRACICFLIIALTQVCNMQRLNQTVQAVTAFWLWQGRKPTKGKMIWLLRELIFRRAEKARKWIKWMPWKMWIN